MSSNLKKMVRDVQRRTGWNYTFCLHLVRGLGYEVVSKAIDGVLICDEVHTFKPGQFVGKWTDLARDLNASVKKP